MKINKSITIFITLVLIATVFYFFLKDSSFMFDKKPANKEKSKESISEQIKRNSVLRQKNDKTVEKEVIKSNQNPYETLKDDSIIWANIRYVCGYDYDALKKIFDKINPSGKISKAQNTARDRLIEGCDYWYKYLNSLSDEHLQLLKKNIDDIAELSKYFNNFKPYNKKMLDEAREFMSQGGDSSSVTHGTLSHLLSQDWEFIDTIAKNLGAPDLKLITNNSYDIATLYGCQVEPQECSSNSLMMLDWCLRFNECGISYIDYYSTSVTPNHFADLMHIVDIIKMLIKQGYFDSSN